MLFAPGFPLRDGNLHRDQAYEYDSIKSPQEREEFFKKYGVRWYSFARLPYFDAVRMTIIDPMHDLLLGMSLEVAKQSLSRPL